MAAVVKKCDCADTRRCKHSWVVRYRASGRQRERSFRHDQKTIANDFALKVEHDKKAGVFIDPKLGDVTVSEWCERWIRQHHLQQQRVRSGHGGCEYRCRDHHGSRRCHDYGHRLVIPEVLFVGGR